MEEVFGCQHYRSVEMVLLEPLGGGEGISVEEEEEGEEFPLNSTTVRLVEKSKHLVDKVLMNQEEQARSCFTTNIRKLPSYWWITTILVPPSLMTFVMSYTMAVELGLHQNPTPP